MEVNLFNDGTIQIISMESWMKIRWDSRDEFKNLIDGENMVDEVTISIHNEKLSYIVLPAYFGGDLYLSQRNDHYVICDCFYRACQVVGQVEIDNTTANFFKKKGYCPIGKTLFKEITRLKSNSVYVIENGILKQYELTYGKSDAVIGNVDDEIQYEEFKSRLNSVVDANIHKSNGILLSGGVDSRLLLLLLKERSDDVSVVTGAVKPYFYSNCSDVLRAEKVARIVGCEIRTDEIDYQKEDISILDMFIDRMPLSVHASLDYYYLLKLFPKGKEMAIWSGQNMDTLYNLGPTERFKLDFHGIAQWFKRFYISEGYISTLPDVNEKALFANKIIAVLGKNIFALKIRDKGLELPKTAQELTYNFATSNDYTVFRYSNAGKNKEYIAEKQYGCSYDVKRELYKSKLSFLSGGDSQAIEVAAYLNDNQLILPYSSSVMVGFFDGLRLKREDVWKPKRYSYRYLGEFEKKYGKGIVDFSAPSKDEVNKRFGKVMDLYDAFEYIIDNTKYGQNLRKGAAIKEQGYTGLMKFDSLLRAYWFNRVIGKLKMEYNVEINENGIEEIGL